MSSEGRLVSKPAAVLCLLCLAWPAGAPSAAQVPDEPAPPAASEEAPTFYSTATVRERSAERSAASVTVVERREIEDSGAASVVEALAFVPGVTVVSGAGGRGLTNVQLRGGDPNFTRVLVDGVPVNDGVYQVGEVFDFQALPAGPVERVEVVRGPLSSYYGSTGLSGVINVVTRRPEGPFAGAIEAAAGDASYRRGMVSAGLAGERDGGGDTRGYGAFLSVLGEEEAERTAEERSELLQAQGRARFGFGPGPGGDPGSGLDLSGRAASWEGDDYPDASGGPVFGSGELRRSEHDELGVGVSLDVLSGGNRLHRGSASAYRHEMERTSPAVFPLVPPSMESTRFTRGRLGGVTSFESNPESGIAGFTWSLGADVEHEEGRNESLLLLPAFLGGATAGDYEIERTHAGAYTELVARRGDLTLELALRADVPDGAAEQLSPRLGLAWAAGPGTVLRASAGRAFKMPSFFALASPAALGGNPDLRPETSVGGDLGVEHRFAGPFAGSGGSLTASLTAFAQRYENLVDFDFELFTHVNRSRVDTRGAELALAWAAEKDFQVSANVTWQEVEVVETGLPLRHRPEWSGALRARWRPRPGFGLQADLRFVSESRDEQIPVPERTRVDGYELLGLAAHWDVTPSWRISGRADNLTDADYENLIGFPGAGRSGRVSIAWRFGSRAGGRASGPGGNR